MIALRRGKTNDDSSPRPIVFVGFVVGHGGDAIQMLELGHGLIQRGHDVTLIVPRLETTVAFAARCRDLGVPVERSRHIRSDIDGSHQNPFGLIRLLVHHRSALLHYHTGDVFLPRTVGLAMTVLRLRPAFATIHSPWRYTDGPARARRWAVAVRRHFVAIICPSQHSRQAQLSYGVDAARVRTIYNAVDLRRFGTGDPARARAVLALPESARLIVFSSRLDPQKHPLDAIAAFAVVARQHADAHLVFIGRGKQERIVREAAVSTGIGDRIHVVGHQERVEDWLAAATVWYLPTETENFSIAVLEAMAAGCAIVSTNCQGNDEVLRHDDNALLTEVGDIAGQAAAIELLLDDAATNRRIGAVAKADAAAYSVERMVDEYEAAYAFGGRPLITIGTQESRR
ncbi:MAG: uncharacterized protein JWM12_79 [Ilumatobacteraceae bacterium]|nr:uncharacterized protein [Ilumatobacteraceae bacterium]